MPAGADIAAWRARILDSLLLAITVLAAAPVFLAARAQYIGDRFVPLGLIVAGGYLLIAGMAAWRRGPYRLRATVMLVVLFALGLFVLHRFGLRAGGRLILVTGAALATVMFGWRVGLLTIVASIVGTAFIGIGHSAGWWSEVPHVSSVAIQWTIGAFTLTLLGGAIVMSTGFLTSRLRGNLAALSETRDELHQRAGVLEAVGAISDGLLRSSRWDDELAERLGSLGRAIGVNRASVVEYADDALHLRAQWTAPGVGGWPSAAPISVSANGLQPFIAALASGRVFVSRPRELPPGPRKLAEQIGMASGVSYPILIEGELWGFLGLSDTREERDWSPFNDILAATAGSLGAAIARDRLRAERERHRAELEERVAARTAELEALSHSVSHDLRAPLRHITGYAEILSEQASAALDEEGKRLLGTIERSAHRMNEQMEALLAFARTGRRSMEPAELDLAPMIRELTDELARDRDIDWQIGELPPVRGDRPLVRQVLANLLGNAVKFTRDTERPRIEVTGRIDGDHVEITVADNGAGFDARYADKLFGVFQRLHKPDQFDGTGIGLALCKRIVDRHGGAITGEGTPGEGATFRFTLPRATL